jgi:hypothetical protein
MCALDSTDSGGLQYRTVVNAVMNFLLHERRKLSDQLDAYVLLANCLAPFLHLLTTVMQEVVETSGPVSVLIFAFSHYVLTTLVYSTS